MLGMAAESQDQADIVHGAVPEEFPDCFPDIDIAPEHYTEAFDKLLTALHEGRPMTIEPIGGIEGFRSVVS